MLLSARILQNAASVNIFDYADGLAFSKGDVVDIYFTIIDKQVDRTAQGFVPDGRRYIPQAGATLSVSMNGSLSADPVVRAATNPYAQDTSIWVVSILATDNLDGLVNMQLTLTQGVVVTHGSVTGAFTVIDPNGPNGGCC